VVRESMSLTRPLTYLWQVGLLAAAYFAAARISLVFAIPPGYATAVWPPSGIALAAALLLGRRVWPGIWIGATLANITVESSFLAAALIGAGNTLEALVGERLIRRNIGVPSRFEHGEDVVKFVLLCALGPVVAATVALGPLALGHPLSWPELLRNWWTWWQGDTAGIIIVTPLILSWSVRETTPWPPQRTQEAVGFGLLLLATAWGVVVGGGDYVSSFSLTFITLPFIIWAAFRFGQREVTTAIAVVCAVAVLHTLDRRDFLDGAPLNEWLLMLLTFISMVVITGLVLVAALGERGRSTNELRNRRDELESRVRERTTELNDLNLALREDIEERKRAEKLLRDSEERFRMIVDNVTDYAIFMLDPQGKVATWNAGAERIKGYRTEEIVGQHFARFYIPEDVQRGKPERELAAAQATGRLEDEGWRLRKDGSKFWANVVITALRDESGTLRGFGKITRDLSERRGSQEQLAYLAEFDPLTGLPNRHMLHDRLTKALAQAKLSGGLFGCLVVDLDRFKIVNETYGHRAGDQLLNQLSARFRNHVRNADTIGRWGGDEFVVVLSSLGKGDDAALVAQKILDALSDPFMVDGRETYISAGIGISIYPKDGGDVDTLLRNADTAMYQAKEQGRNNFQFYLDDMDQRPSQRLQMESSLRGALERGEFLLHYQAKADLVTGAISGFEALLRWQHPERGLVPPIEFIPILEDTGAIIPVGEWVLRSVCEQIKAWQAAGITPRPVSVNVSARQFQRRDLDAVLARIIEEAGIDPAYLQLELTESLLMKDAAETARTLTRLKALGIRLAVDDFGTGYSSLAYLKRFPLDELKIDRAFIRDIVTDPSDAAIALSVISLAHSLRLKVVAEGVETEEQLGFLRTHGCDEMQGFYFSRPAQVADSTQALVEDRHL
jgi:diguanylate cyclase (GGDEF)-like protein/PAS domain S-box-containing protein